ncbi:MAG: cephalosporin hydroxylase family protein [Candidatus Omnitrophica bacterium]|nr:cephalosporin hydroxylase family protein [Candidatus Omnitrophota bacterium]
MYKQDLLASPSSQLTLNNNGSSTTVDLYSQEGLEMVAGLWLKVSCEHRLMYEPTWLGLPIIQFPTDIVMMQELIWKLRPDLIIESGLAHGGSAVLYASLCEMIGKGRVIGIDVEVREHNRTAIRSHPLSNRIEIIEGSSIDPQTFARVKERASGVQTVLVVLDSNHSHDHVLRELNLYHGLVTPGSYLVAMDGSQAHVWDVPRGKREWKEDHPLTAIRQFLKTHPEFQVDPHYTRMHLTSNPDGFLRRLTHGGAG